MALLETFEKQPLDVQDFDIDYSEYLDDLADMPATHQVDVSDPPGLDIGSTSIVGQFIKIWTSGGTPGVKYKITSRMTTIGGRVKEAEIAIKVKDY